MLTIYKILKDKFNKKEEGRTREENHKTLKHVK